MRQHDTNEKKRVIKSIYYPKNIDCKGWITIILIFPTLITFSIVILTILGYNIPSLDNILDTIKSPTKILVFVILMLLGGPLAEEIGWRGYLLGNIHKKYNSLHTSLIIGLIWGLWHLPLFLIKGTTQEGMGLVSFSALIWLIQVLLLSGLYTIIYIKQNKSILAAIVLHFMWNSSGTIITGIGGFLPFHVELTRTIILGIVILLFATMNRQSVSK
jgi:membrane protease YdiL (CAAX protease family)